MDVISSHKASHQAVVLTSVNMGVTEGFCNKVDATKQRAFPITLGGEIGPLTVAIV